MDQETRFKDLFLPERRVWIRRFEGLTTLGCAFAAGIVYFAFAPPFASDMLHFSFFVAMIGGGVFAWSLYRESDLNQLERLAMMAMLLCLVLALLRATASAGVQS